MIPILQVFPFLKVQVSRAIPVGLGRDVGDSDVEDFHLTLFPESDDPLVASVVVSWCSVSVVVLTVWDTFRGVLSSCDASFCCLLCRFFSGLSGPFPCQEDPVDLDSSLTL